VWRHGDWGQITSRDVDHLRPHRLDTHRAASAWAPPTSNGRGGSVSPAVATRGDIDTTALGQAAPPPPPPAFRRRALCSASSVTWGVPWIRRAGPAQGLLRSRACAPRADRFIVSRRPPP